VTTYAYDPAGQLINTTVPDGSFFAFAYDAAQFPSAEGNDEVAATWITMGLPSTPYRSRRPIRKRLRRRGFSADMIL
jgi:YD repeat-containing protein